MFDQIEAAHKWTMAVHEISSDKRNHPSGVTQYSRAHINLQVFSIFNEVFVSTHPYGQNYLKQKHSTQAQLSCSKNNEMKKSC